MAFNNNSINKTRVAFFSDTLVRDLDGANKTMFQLIDRIPTERFDYYFFCGMHSECGSGHKIKEVPTMTIPNNETYKFAFPDMRKSELTSTLDQFAPDVIHIATPSPLGFFALNYANRRNIPVLSIYHTHFISYIKYYLKKLPFLINISEGVVAQTYRKFYNNCDIAYIPTKQIKNELKSCGVIGDNFKIWQRGIDTNLFTPKKKDVSLVRSITNNDYPTILFASRLVWEKNIETLFEIYDRLKLLGMKVNFLVAGNGVGEKEARNRMTDAYFLGFLSHEELAKIYASSDIFLFTSVSETYGNVVAEAMASGCIPVIARGGGSQALVEDGVSGFLCEPYNADDYIKKIIYLLNDKYMCNDMRKAGLKYTSTLCWDNLADEYFYDVESLAESCRNAKCV